MVRADELKKYLIAVDPVNKLYLQAWIRAMKMRDDTEKTVAAHVGHIYLFLRDLGFPDAKTISKDDIEEWYLEKRQTNTRSGKPPSPYTMHGYIISLRAFFKFLRGDEEGNSLVNIKVKLPESDIREDMLCTREDVKKLMESCTNERDRAIVAITSSAGIRLGELCNLRIGDVRIEQNGGYLYVSGKTGKRVVDIFEGLPELQIWLNVHPLKNDPAAPLWVTHHKYGNIYRPLRDKSIQTLFKRLGERSGVASEKLVNPHAHRHASATDMAQDMTTADLNLRYGWATRSHTSSRYVHTSKQRVRAILAKRSGVEIPEKLPEPSPLVIQCPICHTLNPAGAKYCCQCRLILDKKLKILETKILTDLANPDTQKKYYEQ